ncbi:MAG TPA: hypothetical protein VGI92_03600 [Gemmatimonadales bacterium]|jgi:plastocyanin
MVKTGVALLMVLAASRATAQETGRIEGVASIANRLVGSRLRVRVYEDAGTPPPRPDSADSRFANVVLYLESTTPIRGHAVPVRPVMMQSGERFVPHVLPVLVGTTVEFPNDDPIYHNVFSLSRVRSFDLGRYPRGSSKSVLFSSPGVVQVFCHIHADMNGYILVLDNPFFVVPDPQGHFVIEGIPPGEYRLVAWHERIHPMVTPIRVEAGHTLNLELRIPLADTGSVR